MSAVMSPTPRPEIVPEHLVSVFKQLVSLLKQLKAPAYLAAVGGVLLATVSDYVKNQPISVMDKIGNGMFPASEYRLILALILLIVTGFFFCWIFEPQNRIDGFWRGVSALSLLTIVAPQSIDQPLKSQSSLGSPVRTSAAALAAAPDAASGPAASAFGGAVVVSVKLEDGQARPFAALVTLRNGATGSIVARQQVRTTEFEIAQKNGRYDLELEVDGYRRVRAKLDIGLGPAAYEIELERSDVPLELQRLYPADDVELTRVESPTATQ